MIKKIFIFISFIALSAANVYADVSIETAVSRSRVSVGEEIKLDIIVSDASGPVSKPVISSIEGFSSYSQGHSQEISIINGQMSSRSIFSYILMANDVGKRIIGPFELKIGNKIYKIAAVEVEVVATGSYAQPSSGNRPVMAQGPITAPSPRSLPSSNVSDQDIFVKAWLDKDEVYVNEPVILTYTIYTRLSATYKGFEKEPVTTGFWVEDFPPDKNIRRTEQIFNGSRYVVADVRKICLFPTQTGVFTVDPGVLSAIVEVRDQDSFNSFFSSNIMGYRTQRPPQSFMSQVISKSVPSDPVTITVKALPDAGKPDSFNGALGNYEIESSIDKSQVEVGTPVTYRVRIIGQGNINTVQVPPAPKLSDFKVYDSASSVNISKERLLVEGEKVVETVLVPKKAGKVTIPPLSFSYFEPRSKTYKEIRSSSHELTAIPGTETVSSEEESEVSSGVQAAEKKDVAVVGKDIRYIKTSVPATTYDTVFYKKPVYWFFQFLIVFAAWFLLFLSSRKESTSKDLRGLRFRRSHRLARKKLQNAAVLLKKGENDAFYAEISQTLYGYFGDKLNMPSQKVSVEAIQQALPEGEPSEQISSEIKALFDELSYGRFAKSEKDGEAMKKVYEMADRVITQFERVKLK